VSVFYPRFAPLEISSPFYPVPYILPDSRSRHPTYTCICTYAIREGHDHHGQRVFGRGVRPRCSTARGNILPPRSGGLWRFRAGCTVPVKPARRLQCTVIKLTGDKMAACRYVTYLFIIVVSCVAWCDVQAMLPEGFPFHHFNITYYSWCLVPVWRL